MESDYTDHKGRKMAVSLFSSAGIGELGIEKNAIDVIAASELKGDRGKLYNENFPETKMFVGDIWETKEDIINYSIDALQNEELFLLYATPPCQGMSTNGVGKLNAEARNGNRPAEDPRNRLVLPAMDVISKLHPRWVLFENVSGMQNTMIKVAEHGEPVRILDYIAEQLGPEYAGRGEVLSCADYGIPQIRKRLISVFTRDPEGIAYFRANDGTFFPSDERTKPVTLREAIGGIPPLDAKPGREAKKDFHPLHYVNILNPEKYLWVTHTPEGDTAFNNQCINPDCGSQENPRYVDKHQEGRWQSNKLTPIYCVQCGLLLPRPTMTDPQSGERRLISGFHSAYRRMPWDEPSRTLTRNFPFEASDNKIHPEQNRVLSVYEALVIQSITDYEYRWEIGGKPVTRSLIAQAIGESVPPKLIDFIVSKMLRISAGLMRSSYQAELFDPK